MHLFLDNAAHSYSIAFAFEPHMCAAAGTSLQRGSQSWMMGRQNFRQANRFILGRIVCDVSRILHCMQGPVSNTLNG